MASITKQFLSASVDGRNILINAVSTAGDTIHAAHATDKDEIWLWAVNSDATDRKLTIEFGGVLAPADLIEVTIPGEDGLYLVIPGRILSNSLVVAAFAALTDVIAVGGYVNRISP